MDRTAAGSSGLQQAKRAGVFGLLAGTRIRTLDGLLPVEFLGPGDRIVCRGGARRLVAIDRYSGRDMPLVRIRASTLGHDRPDSDMLVAPDQPILIRDWRARALYGQTEAAVPASRLVDGEFVLSEVLTTASLLVLRFAEDEVIYAEGLEIACLVHTPLPLEA